LTGSGEWEACAFLTAVGQSSVPHTYCSSEHSVWNVQELEAALGGRRTNRAGPQGMELAQ
jgi:hypothetical protein